MYVRGFVERGGFSIRMRMGAGGRLKLCVCDIKGITSVCLVSNEQYLGNISRLTMT